MLSWTLQSAKQFFQDTLSNENLHKFCYNWNIAEQWI